MHFKQPTERKPSLDYKCGCDGRDWKSTIMKAMTTSLISKNINGESSFSSTLCKTFSRKT